MKRISSLESNTGEAEEEKALAVDGTDETTEFCDDDDEDEFFGNGRSGLPYSSCLGEKKRRLGVDQVKALQNNFEVDNKLDPERKLRLAQDLGLQPRQVAVWFQNRRARWKAKLLERDFTTLKARHDALKFDCDALRRDNRGLLAQIEELKAKLSVSTEAPVETSEERPPLMYNYKDGASDDSDSSCVVFHDEVQKHEHLTGFKSSLDQKESAEEHVDEKGGYEHLDDEELCSSLFSEQPVMSLSPWYSSHQWD